MSKCVDFEDVKVIVELGIKNGWTLQDFRENMDLWDDFVEGYRWRLCSEEMPKCEQEVLICTEKKIVGKNSYIDNIITPAIYEDGTLLEKDSSWRWEDIDYEGWDEEEDCGIIPEGWWENRHFNPDECYNNPVDRKVIAWMPLPTPYQEDNQ